MELLKPRSPFSLLSLTGEAGRWLGWAEKACPVSQGEAWERTEPFVGGWEPLLSWAGPLPHPLLSTVSHSSPWCLPQPLSTLAFYLDATAPTSFPFPIHLPPSPLWEEGLIQHVTWLVESVVQNHPFFRAKGGNRDGLAQSAHFYGRNWGTVIYLNALALSVINYVDLEHVMTLLGGKW